MMDETCKILTLGALLHDVGKVVQRATLEKENHSILGAKFVGDILGEDYKDVINCIRYHHARDLDGLTSAEDIAYIIYEADNIASAIDRRRYEQDAETKAPYERTTPLYSIFNAFRYDPAAPPLVLPLTDLREDAPLILPLSKDDPQAEATSGRYQQLLNGLESRLREFNFQTDSLNSVLKLLEAYTSYVPSSTATEELADISLFQHLKITAAVACSIYYYLDAQKRRDYRQECYTESQKLRNEAVFLLVSGDMSGIQNFIYTISSQGALKSLRGRSFYLEILMEHIIDQLLSAASLCRANLIYSGGGHFYLLFPNITKTVSLLEDARKNINQWLLKELGTALYLELAWQEATAEELGNQLEAKVKTQNLIGDLFANTGGALSSKKLKRYAPEQLEQILDPHSCLYASQDAERECAVCGNSGAKLVPLHPLEEEGVRACENCAAFFWLGDQLPRFYSRNDAVTVLTVKKSPQDTQRILKLPDLNGQDDLFLSFQTRESVRDELQKEEDYINIYSLNRLLAGRGYITNIWAGIYCAPAEGSAGLVDFESLAERSYGIKRLGVLRADVDNLGQAFISGFESPKRREGKYQYVSLTRSAALSYFLSLFFKFEINKICSGKAGLQRFTLPGKFGEEKGERNLTIVYSGGDDLFVVGAWDDVLEFAVELRRAFDLYTDHKMTLSAGFGLYRPKFPIHQMASLSGNLEEAAKKMPGKDAIALFGPELNEKGISVYPHLYKWDVFISGVIGEKLAGLTSWFDFSPDRRNQEKLEGTMSQIYKLLALFRGMSAKDKAGRLNLARLAYTLARMEPSTASKESLKELYRQMRDAIYKWALTPEDRKQFVTALNLLIYLNRKGEKENE